MKPRPAPRAPVYEPTPTGEEHREQPSSRLVAAARAGDKEALRDVIAWAMDYLFPAVLSMLYERHGQGDYLTETLHRGGPDFGDRVRDDAWAVTHAACCRIAQRIDTFRGRNALGRPVQFGTWAYAVAQNEVRTLLRSRRRERRRYGGSVDEWGDFGTGVDSGGRRTGGTATGAATGAAAGSGPGTARGVAPDTASETTSRAPLERARGPAPRTASAPASETGGAAGGGNVKPTPDPRLHRVESSPEQAALGKLESALVREALQQAPLTPEQREAVVLFHGYGYRQEQIAAMTGVQVGTVKKRVFDGLRKLRAYVESRQSGPGQERSPAPPKRQRRGGR